MANWDNCEWDNFYWNSDAAVPAVTVPDAATTWIIQVAWSGASYSGFNEAKYCKGLKIHAGRQSYIAYGATSLSPMSPGTLSLTLDNTSGRYDAYLHSTIRPGKKIRVIEKYNDTGARKTLFTGQITNISAPSWPDKAVTIEAVDVLKKAQEHKFTNPLPPLYYATIDQCIKYFLDAAGIPSDLQPWAQSVGIFDPTGPLDQVINPYGPQDPHAAKQANGQSVLEDLSNAALGTIFADRSGVMRFYPLDYTGMATHDLDQSDLLKEIVPTQPWDVLRNQIQLQVALRGKEPLGSIWYDASVTPINTGQQILIDISYPPSTDIVTTLAGGVDIFAYDTASPTMTSINYGAFIYAILVNCTSTKATLSLYSYAATTLYITSKRVRGCKFKETTANITVSDATSITDNDSIRDLQLKSPWLQDQGYANAYASLLLAFLKDPQMNPTLQIQGHPSTQFGYELMDHVHFTSAKLGADDTYSIGGMDIEWLTDAGGVCNGQSCLTTLYLQKVLFSDVPITGSPYYPGLDPVPPDNGAGSGNNTPTLWGVSFPFGWEGSVDNNSICMVEVPGDCTLTNCTIMADTTGVVTFDIQKASYAGAPNALSICGTALPALHNEQKAVVAMTGWNLKLAAGDWLYISVHQAVGLQAATLALRGVIQ